MPDDRRTLLDQADRALNRGDMAQAASAYRKLVALSPNDPALLQRLGDALARAGQELEARDVFRQLADEYWKSGLRPRAMAALRRAVRLGPPDRSLLTALGQRLLEQGLTADAREPLLEAGRLAEAAEDKPAAAEAYRQVADLLPKDAACREGLVRLADRSGSAAERSTARIELALAKLRAGDATGGFRLLAEAVEVDAAGLSAFDRLPQILGLVGTLPIDTIPEAPKPLKADAAAGWTILRVAMAQRLGLIGGAGAALRGLLGSGLDLHPRVRLWAGRLLLQFDDFEGATDALLGLDATIEQHPALVPEVVEALSSLVAHNPGEQRVMEFLLRLSMPAEERSLVGADIADPGAQAFRPFAPPAAPGADEADDTGTDAIVVPTGDAGEDDGSWAEVAPRSIPLSPGAGTPPAGKGRYSERAEDRAPHLLSAEAQARVVEAEAFLRQGLEDRAREALAAVPPADADHPVVRAAAVRIPARFAAPPRPVPPPARAAHDDDDLFVIEDGDELEPTAVDPGPTPARAADPAHRTEPHVPPPEPPPTQPVPVVPADSVTTASIRARIPSVDAVDLAQLEQSIHRVVDPQDAEMGYQMALGLVEMGLGDQAIPLLETALADPRRRVDAVVLLSRVRRERGQAERAYQEALAVHYGSESLAPALQAEVFALLTELALETSRIADAKVFIAELTRIYPAHPALPRLRARF